MDIRTAVFALTLAGLLAGCGRFGFDEGGVFSAVPVSDAQALVGCASALSGDGNDRYGVVWHEYPAPGGDRHSLMYARVDTGGTIVDGPTAIDNFSDEIAALWIHPVAEGGFLVFIRRASTNETRMAQIDANGRLVTARDIGDHPSDVFLIATDTGFALFYEDNHELHWAPMDAGGALLGEPAAVDIPVARDGEANALEHPRVAYTQNGYHVAFSHAWGIGIGYAHLDRDAGYIDGWIADFGAHRNPQIAGDGDGNLAVTWYDGEQLTEYGLDAQGVPLWTGVRQIVAMNRQQSQTPVLAGGDRIALVWESDAESVLPQIAFRPIDVSSEANPNEASPELLSDSRFAHTCPQIARGAGHFGVAFRGAMDGGHRLLVGIRHD